MKKILWVEDQSNFIFDDAEHLFNLSSAEAEELKTKEDILLRKKFLRDRQIFIEADFITACSAIFNEYFDVIILDINFPTDYREKDKPLIEKTINIFTEAFRFTGSNEERIELEQIFHNILQKPEYSGLLLFYLACLYYERQLQQWDLSDIKTKVCFFTGNNITMPDFWNLLKQRFSDKMNLLEGSKIREYKEAVKDNFWLKDDGLETIKAFIEYDPCLDILKQWLGDEAKQHFIRVTSNKDSNHPVQIANSLSSLRLIVDNMLTFLEKNLNAYSDCRNEKWKIINWFKYRVERKWCYRYGASAVTDQSLSSIYGIASDFGAHDDWINQPKTYKPTANTVNALIYAMKDVILWFGKICNGEIK